jgi:hypothetical protein
MARAVAVKQRVRDRLNGVDDAHMSKLAMDCTKALTMRRLPAVRDELDNVGLTGVGCAHRLAQAVAYMDSSDLQERYFGLAALRLVLKVRGDLVADKPLQTQGGQPPINLAVFINAIRELRSTDIPAHEIPHDSATIRPDGDSED